MNADDSVVEGGDEPLVRLVRWTGPWSDDDPDANLKADVATYANADPVATLVNLGRNVDLPVGALVRYVLAKWASGGSEGLLELGPSTVERMAGIVSEAESEDSDEARLDAYHVLRQVVSWLEVGRAEAASTYPDGGAGPLRHLRVGAYGVILDEDDRLLLCRIAGGFPGEGRWTLPGGGLDHGEDPRDGALREIHEETGLRATLGALLDVSARHYPRDRTRSGTDLHWVRVLFRAEVPAGGAPRVVDVDGSTDDVRWFRPGELPHIEVTELVDHARGLIGHGGAVSGSG